MADRFQGLYLGTIFKKKENPPCCPLVNFADSNTIDFTGLGTLENPVTANVILSNTPQSKYLLSATPPDGVAFNGPKMRDISVNTPIYMYGLNSGGIFDGIDIVTKNGAMTSAVISKQGDYDRIAVTGGNATSYLILDKQSTLNQFSIILRVKINSIGAAPLLGLQGIWPGLTYSNFNNAQYFGYVNLATGVITATSAGTNTSYNGFLGTVLPNDIIEIRLDGDFLVGSTLTIKKISGFTGEVSMDQTIKSPTADGWVFHQVLSIIMADGDYTILQYIVNHTDTFKPKICVVGDSMSSGVRIVKADSVIGKFKAKLPYRASSIGAGSCLTKGSLATIYEALNIYPEYMVIFFYLDPIYYDKANPANGSYATFSADFARYVNTIKEQGIKPIFIHPQTWAILDPSGVKCAFYTTFLNTFYPTERTIFLSSSELFYDGTGFHYNGVTNGIIADKVIALLESEGAL